MTAYANKFFVCFFVSKKKKKNRSIYWVDIIHSLLYKINNYWYNLLNLVSSLIKENNGYSLIWGHRRRVFNNSSEDAKQFLKNSREWFALLNAVQIFFSLFLPATEFMNLVESRVCTLQSPICCLFYEAICFMSYLVSFCSCVFQSF